MIIRNQSDIRNAFISVSESLVEASLDGEIIASEVGVMNNFIKCLKGGFCQDAKQGIT